MAFLTKSEIEEKKRKEAEKAALAKMSCTERLKMVYSKKKPAKNEVEIPAGLQEIEDYKEEVAHHKNQIEELMRTAPNQRVARLSEIHKHSKNLGDLIKRYERGELKTE